MSTFKVEILSFKQLSDGEKLGASNNGCGKEYANYIRVSNDGETVLLENDAMEPEDVRFTRDLSWVKDIILYAYQCGLEDGEAVERGAAMRFEDDRGRA